MQITKMHGSGNSFIVIDYDEGIDYSNLSKFLCNQNIGVGGDGVIVVKKNPLEMLIFNKDGSSASMCGNALRCFTRYCYDNVIKKSEYKIVTKSGIYRTSIESMDPFIVKCECNILSNIKQIDSNMYMINSGVKHVVILPSFLKNEAFFAKKLSNRYNANIDYVDINNRKSVKIKTFELGVGFTKACGTGALAVCYVLKFLNLIDDECICEYEYGNIKVILKDKVYIEGPCEYIFEGESKICRY